VNEKGAKNGTKEGVKKGKKIYLLVRHQYRVSVTETRKKKGTVNDPVVADSNGLHLVPRRQTLYGPSSYFAV
jgi:hypothetical protein